MKQTLHIFSKDTRRLWPQIAAVAVLFAVYAIFSPDTTPTAGPSLIEWNGIPAALVVLACWALGASAMQEDSPAEESPFWLTRPYSRWSLVASKVLFLLAFVFVPLLISGVILEARSGVSVGANAGTLLGLCLVRSLWLILPAIPLGAVTRNLLAFAGRFSAAAVVLLLFGMLLGRSSSFLPSNPLRDANVIAVFPMVLGAVAAVGVQFALRRTQWSQGLLAVGVVQTALMLPMPSVALFSVSAMNPGLDTGRVQVTFDSDIQEAGFKQIGFCSLIPVKVQGLPPNTFLRPIGASAEFRSQDSTRNIRKVQFDEKGDGFREVVCPDGPYTTRPQTLESTVRFEVVEISPVASMAVRRGMLDAGPAGRCEVAGDVNTQLRCVLAQPVSGAITAGLEYPGFQSFTGGFGDAGTFPLSPVLRKKFDGVSYASPGGWPIDDALKRGDARFVLRKERVVGTVTRTLVDEHFVMPGFRMPPRHLNGDIAGPVKILGK